jgi:hypothetical protein
VKGTGLQPQRGPALCPLSLSSDFLVFTEWKGGIFPVSPTNLPHPQVTHLWVSLICSGLCPFPISVVLTNTSQTCQEALGSPWQGDCNERHGD